MTTLVYPATLTAGANENVNDLNANLNAVAAVVNGNIDASNLAAGAVTTPKFAVAPRARAFRTTVATLATGTATAINFDNETFDTDTIHDNVTNPSRLTCRTAGLYLITASVEWTAAAGTKRLLYLRLNGTTRLAVDYRPPVSGDVTGQNLATFYPLVVNDYVELIGFHDAGANLDVSVTSIQPALAMTWVGA